MAINLARHRELHPDLSSQWTLFSASSAVNAHERGDFSQSARLVDAMGRDDRIDATLGTRIQAMLGLDFELQASEDGDGRSNKSVAKQFTKQWFRLCTEEALGEALKWRIMLGFGIGELIWFDDRGRLQSAPQRLKLWHPQHARYDFEREKFLLRTADGPEVEVNHGDGKWVIFGNGQRPWMRGAVRALWILWLARQYAFRDWNLFSERTGQGILGVKTIHGADSGERDQLVAKLEREWRGIIAALPQTGDDNGGANSGLDLLETEAGEDVFDKLIAKSDVAIAVRLLGQNLTTEVKGGSFAAANAHDRVRIDYLRADVDQTATDTKSGILEPWAERVHGSRDLAPDPHWDADPPADEAAIADAQKTFGEAIAAVQNAGYDVKNVDELADRHGFKLEKRPEPAPAPGGALPVAGQKPGTAGAQPANSNGRRVAATQLAQGGHDDPGFVQGAEYLDALVAAGTQRAQQALANEIAAIQTIIRSSQTPAELKAGLAALYAGADQSELGTVLERARIMAEMAGKYSVIEDINGSA